MDYHQSYQATQHDVGKLTEYDLKCFDLPMDSDSWDAFVKLQNKRDAPTYARDEDNFGLEIPTDRRTITRIITGAFSPIAWWAGVYCTPTYQKGDLVERGKVKIVRMGVLPGHRGKGYTHALLSDIRSWLRRDFIRPDDYDACLVVPEYLLQPGWDNFIGGWLVKHGFKPSKTKMLKPSRHTVYGQTFQHIVRFDFPRLPTLDCL